MFPRGTPLASGSSVSRTDFSPFSPFLQMQQMGENARQFNVESAFKALDQKMKAGQFQQEMGQNQYQFDATRSDRNERDMQSLQAQAAEAGQARLERDTNRARQDQIHSEQRSDLMNERENQVQAEKEAQRRREFDEGMKLRDEQQRNAEETRRREAFDWDKKRQQDIDAGVEKAKADKVKYQPVRAEGEAKARDYMSRALPISMDEAVTGAAAWAAKKYPNDPEAQAAFVESVRSTYAKREQDKTIGAGDRKAALVERANLRRQIIDALGEVRDAKEAGDTETAKQLQKMVDELKKEYAASAP